jgi:serine/threonine-protein kinase
VDATNRLQASGLLARIDQVDSNHPEGTVIAQSIPQNGRTSKGKIVTIKVSRGGSQVKIPDVRGKEFPDAARALEDAGLKVGAVVRVADQANPANTVIAQNPASPAMIVSNRMVDLLVSEGGTGGPDTVQVPDLRGQDEEHARQILEQTGLAASKVITLASDQMPEGAVIRTEPRNGARVPSGRAVTLYIAEAPGPPAVQVYGAASPAERHRAAEVSPAPAASPAPKRAGAANPYAPQPETAPPNQAAAIPEWNPATQPASPAAPKRKRENARAQAGSKMAKIRYQVPPLARPLGLVISISDMSGPRTLKQQRVNGGEYISMDSPYSGEATVTMTMDGQRVWQEKFK